jgi:hypothetical protein
MVAAQIHQAQRADQARSIVYYATTGGGFGWQPTLRDDGRVTISPATDVEMTPALIAALIYELGVLGRKTPAASEAIGDALLVLRGKAQLAVTGGVVTA